VLVEWVFWLSIVGHDSWAPWVLRLGGAMAFGTWAGRTRGWVKGVWREFLWFEAPQVLVLTGIALVSLAAAPRDPAALPFLGATVGLSVLDLLVWLGGFLIARRRRVRNAAPGEVGGTP
jgi:hypothetical protein